MDFSNIYDTITELGDNMYSLETLPLKRNERTYFSVNHKRLEILKHDLDSFLVDQDYMLSKEFAKNVLFTHEVKFNNAVEEYNDDIKLIQKVISNPTKKNLTEQERRIINLYKGYHYIFDEIKDIHKNSLKELYHILSDQLLSREDFQNMGEYYRKNPVFIYFSNNLSTPPDKGIDAKKIDEYMDYFFHYIENNNPSDMTEKYIKSQIMHFYFVYIHPFYDINGRTSRTTSIWYLLNEKAYPYIIFNRGISLQKNSYYKVIRSSKGEGNLTYFLEYMLKTVLVELQKEYVIHQIKEEVPINTQEHQTLQYILSMNGLKTYGDFCRFYNYHNEKRSNREIYESMLLPLFKKEVLKIDRNSKKFLYGTFSNALFDLNIEHINIEKEKVRLLKI